LTRYRIGNPTNTAAEGEPTPRSQFLGYYHALGDWGRRFG